MTYTLEVRNIGTIAAQGVQVVDALPSGTTVNTIAGPNCTVSPTNTVHCNIGTIAAGSSAWITFYLQVQTNSCPTDLYNAAGAYGNNFSTVTSNTKQTHVQCDQQQQQQQSCAWWSSWTDRNTYRPGDIVQYNLQFHYQCPDAGDLSFQIYGPSTKSGNDFSQNRATAISCPLISGMQAVGNSCIPFSYYTIQPGEVVTLHSQYRLDSGPLESTLYLGNNVFAPSNGNTPLPSRSKNQLPPLYFDDIAVVNY